MSEDGWTEERYGELGLRIWTREDPFVAINYYPPYKNTKGTEWIFNVSRSCINWQPMPDTIDNIDDAKQYALAIARLEG